MTKRTLFFLIVFLVSFIGLFCKTTKKDVITRKKHGNYFIEAHFINNEKIDGIAKYYDINENLISIVNYKNDIKYGPAINYTNGMIKDSMFYNDGLINGKAFAYDSSGHLNKMMTYYYGILVGDNILFSSGKPKKYYFNDFNSNTLLSCNYDSSGRCLMGEFALKPITNIIGNDIKSTMSLFLYLPRPPNLSITFEIGLTNENNEKKNETLIQAGRLFLDTILSKPDTGWHYYVSTHIENINDSINKVVIHELKWQ